MPRSYIRWIHSNTPARCCPLMKFTGPPLSGISTERKVNWGCSPTCWDGTGGDIRTSERFYVVVVHFFLISGSDSWVMLTHIMWELGSLHNQVARKISGQIPW